MAIGPAKTERPSRASLKPLVVIYILALLLMTGLIAVSQWSPLNLPIHLVELSVLMAIAFLILRPMVRVIQDDIVEVKFRRVLELAPDGIIIIEKKGNILYANAEAERIFGYGHEELVGLPVEALIPAQSRRAYVEFRENVIRGVHERQPMARSLDFRGLRKDGSEFPADISLSPMPADGDYRAVAAIRDVTDRRRIEEELRRNREEILLHQEFVKASEREQRHLGENLHDGLGQSLTGIAYLSKALAEKLEEKNAPESRDALNIVRRVNETIVETRRLARGLAPLEIAKKGILPALEDLALHIKADSGIDCDLDCDREVSVGDAAVSTHLYRIAQEAAANAMKHGHARHVAIRLFRDGNENVLTVLDDGRGISAEAKNDRGMGLQIMRCRAGAIGGRFEVGTRDERGTVVTVRFPGNHDSTPLTASSTDGCR